MRWLRWTALVVMVGGVPLSGAQRSAPNPLNNGHLVVWVVQPDPPAQPTADEVRRTLHTTTAGSFGRNASEVGQTAGSYSGGSASATAVKSSPAGSTGTTAGSFGETLDTIAAAGDAKPVPAFEPAELGRAWETLASTLASSFNSLQLRVVPVRAVDLEARFAAAEAGGERPDVLLGQAPLVERSPFLAARVLVRLGVPRLEELPVISAVRGLPARPAEWLLLREAPHPAEARAFVVWLRDGRRTPANAKGAAVPETLRDLATGAAEDLLRGVPIAGRDRTMVAYAPAEAQRQALDVTASGPLQGLQVQVSVMAEAANERLAVFALRAVAGSPDAFGVVYPLVVLWRGEEGRWTVLHVTGNTLAQEPTEGAGPLQRFAAARLLPEQVKAVRGVALAAPVDGDTRGRQPDLWWDDPGEAEELVVEWSRDQGDAHLLCISDAGPRLQVRVPAGFADAPGVYQWRVWSVGSGGVLQLSPWRRFTVVP